MQYSKWTAPIVAADKADGEVKICGHLKITVNPELEVDQHQKFSKLPVSLAYLQMEVAEECRHILTVNTHQGLYQYR